MPGQSRDWKADVDAIRQILMAEWDPIGCGVPDDEYDDFIPAIYNLMQAQVGEPALAAHLEQIETKQICLPARPDVNRRVATLLLALMDDSHFGHELSMIHELTDRIHVVEGDITRLDVDAIVNAANTSLLGGGGVDGAIHRRAGPKLLAECQTLGGCLTGEARLTQGYDLPAKHVIHTVGPVYHGGHTGEAELLRSCYVESLRLAAEHGIATIAFPAISTGAYDYPLEEACGIAMDAVLSWLRDNEQPREVTFCCFQRGTAALYRELLRRPLIRVMAGRCP